MHKQSSPVAASVVNNQESGAAAVGNQRRDSADSVNEYEADEFEKEDLVQMAEPQKPVMKPPKPHKKQIGDQATNDTTSRAGIIDSNSLMHEISLRNNKQLKSENLPPQLA